MRHSGAMNIRLRLSTMTSTAGQTVTLPHAGVTCVVGSNNAGKSQLLRDLLLSISSFQADPVTIAQITGTRPSGTVAESEEWLDAKAVRLPLRPGQSRLWVNAHGSGQISAKEFQGWFTSGLNQGPVYLGNSASYFVQHSTAGSLASYATGSISPRGDGGNAPLSALFRDGVLEEELSNLVFDTFGVGLVLDRINPEIRLRVGEVDVPIPPLNRPTSAYAEAVAALPTLDTQGDGMRSFVGLALHVLASAPDILLVDEPEAFLHPGQARALGRWLAAEAIARDVQVILATHDRDIVLGLLDSEPGTSVNLIRIARVGDGSHLSQLPPDEVRAVWDDPVLKYSNVLQGLFHRKVVVCESDADCRFFGAALNELAVSTGRRAQGDDILFVPSGSKNRVSALAVALTKLGVEAACIVDFDVLRSKADMQKIVGAVGGRWGPKLDDLYRTAFRSDNQTLLWQRLKNLGLAGVTAGQSVGAGQELLAELRAIGVHVVPVGEIEDFDRAIASHGASWVSTALEKNVHTSAPVLELVHEILKSPTPTSV